MNQKAILLAAIAALTYSTSNANLTNVTWNVSGGLDNSWYQRAWAGTDLTGMTMHANESGTGMLSLGLETDGTDPTFSITSDTINTSGFTWTSYLVDVTMGASFSFSSVVDNIPGDWSVSVTGPTGPDMSGNYDGQLLFTAGTPVPVGGEFEFSYAVTFTGGPVISFAETLTPAPEPGSLSMILGGALVLGGWGVARRRRILAC